MASLQVQRDFTITLYFPFIKLVFIGKYILTVNFITVYLNHLFLTVIENAGYIKNILSFEVIYFKHMTP
jgi:hypothetical protein